MAASMIRTLAATSRPSRSLASLSAVEAEYLPATTPTGDRSDAVMRMAGRNPGCPATACVFSEYEAPVQLGLKQSAKEAVGIQLRVAR